ncbi:MAG: hypothetical protein JW860_08220 [Sedimentisphaerales bacterium]|nr:hypothetical protein [Sedimentisphaerales bacterium]
MEQWQIDKSSGVCAGTGAELKPGDEYYAALIDSQDRFERRDYSCQYWQQHQPEVYSFWKTKVPLPNEKKKLFVDDGILINFFERLEGEKEPVKVNFRFVLALILMRKRLLKYEDTRREAGHEIWQMRFVREKEFHEVLNPQLDDEQIEQVSHELSSILRGEL